MREVSFSEDALLLVLVEQAGQHLAGVPIRLFYSMLSIDWASQYQRLQRDAVLALYHGLEARPGRWNISMMQCRRNRLRDREYARPTICSVLSEKEGPTKHLIFPSANGERLHRPSPFASAPSDYPIYSSPSSTYPPISTFTITVPRANEAPLACIS